MPKRKTRKSSPRSTQIRVAAWSSDDLAGSALANILGRAKGITLAKTLKSSREANAWLKKNRVDVVVVDVPLDADGLDAARTAARAKKSLGVVLFIAGEAPWLFGALKAGARGFVERSPGGEEALLDAIRNVQRGRIWIDAHFSSKLAGQVDQKGGSGLTKRERQVLRYAAKGYRNWEIAEAVGCGEGTIRTHMRTLFSKTGVRGRKKLAQHAKEQGLI